VGSFCIRPVYMGCAPCAFNNIVFYRSKKKKNFYVMLYIDKDFFSFNFLLDNSYTIKCNLNDFSKNNTFLLTPLSMLPIGH
jgi:hypothetical protein